MKTSRNRSKHSEGGVHIYDVGLKKMGPYAYFKVSVQIDGEDIVVGGIPYINQGRRWIPPNCKHNGEWREETEKSFGLRSVRATIENLVNKFGDFNVQFSKPKIFLEDELYTVKVYARASERDDYAVPEDNIASRTVKNPNMVDAVALAYINSWRALRGITREYNIELAKKKLTKST